MTNKKKDKTYWILGGTTVLGTGIGFFLLKTQGGLAFAGSILAGVGIGLVLVPIISSK